MFMAQFYDVLAGEPASSVGYRFRAGFRVQNLGGGGLFGAQDRPDNGSKDNVKFLDVGLAGVTVSQQAIVYFAPDEAFEQQDEGLD